MKTVYANGRLWTVNEPDCGSPEECWGNYVYKCGGRGTIKLLELYRRSMTPRYIVHSCERCKKEKLDYWQRDRVGTWLWHLIYEPKKIPVKKITL